MTFEEYLLKKKIDSRAFQENEPERWKEWDSLFMEMHPNSFTEQKKFLINDIRRKYQLKEEAKKDEAPKKSGPAIKIPPRKN